MPLEGPGSVEVVERPFTTVHEFLAWLAPRPPEDHYDVVDGQPVLTPSPTVKHQWVLMSLARLLGAGCPADHVVLPAPLDWVLWEAPRLHLRQPDLVVVSRDVVGHARLTRPPLLVVEVLSSTSVERDLVAKREAYAQAGLLHYWVVDPDQPQVVVFRRDVDALEIVARASGDERLAVNEPFPITVTPHELLD